LKEARVSLALQAPAESPLPLRSGAAILLCRMVYVYRVLAGFLHR
jgi:hypothetical protein